MMLKHRVFLKIYIISLTIILLEFSLGFLIDVYYNWYISLFMRILLMIDCFFVPFIILVKDIINDEKIMIKRIFKVSVVTLGIFILFITGYGIFDILDKSIFNIYTENIVIKDECYFVKENIFDVSSWIDVYKKKNFLFCEYERSYRESKY